MLRMVAKLEQDMRDKTNLYDLYLELCTVYKLYFTKIYHRHHLYDNDKLDSTARRVVDAAVLIDRALHNTTCVFLQRTILK